MPRGLVDDADRRRDLVHVLTARARADERRDLRSFSGISRRRLLELGDDVDGGETGLAFAFGVEGADARQPVRAALAVRYPNANGPLMWSDTESMPTIVPKVFSTSSISKPIFSQ